MATLDDLDELDPQDNEDIAAALAFLRLVVRNNPNRTAAEIADRPDVQSALDLIQDWLDQASELLVAVVSDSPLVPASAVDAIIDEAQVTLDKLEDDISLTEENVDDWASTSEPEIDWAAKIILRMTWFVNWLRGLVGQGAVGVTKTWTSRLAPNTCTYCRRLHGTTIGIQDSFADAAIAVGFARIYGGLHSPPLHPRCACWCSYSVVDTSSEEG